MCGGRTMGMSEPVSVFEKYWGLSCALPDGEDGYRRPTQSPPVRVPLELRRRTGSAVFVRDHDPRTPHRKPRDRGGFKNTWGRSSTSSPTRDRDGKVRTGQVPDGMGSSRQAVQGKSESRTFRPAGVGL